MQKIELDLGLYRFAPEELPADERELMQKAREMSRTAYAPYSGFGVGAALLLESGEIIGGSNQENAAYPSGLCAERVALFMAGANYKGQKILKMAIAVHSGKKESDRIYAPCGACRQVISEYQDIQSAPIRILFEGPGTFITVAGKIEDLLPFTFQLKA